MAKTWYDILIERTSEHGAEPIKRRVNATNAKKAAQTAAAEYGFTLTGKAPNPRSSTSWHATDDEGRGALVTASK